MNYEKFNDAMCQLRQAEENLNNALRDVAVAINEIERKPQKLQENNDEEYRKGLKDLHEALRIIAAEDEMSVSDLFDVFDTCSVCDIILGFTPEEIIDKVLEWKTKPKKEEKEDQELHVGDEVMTDDGTIGIVAIVDDKIVWIVYKLTASVNGFDSSWFYKDRCKKTGRHFDSIPFDYNPEKGK